METKILNFPDAMKLASILSKYVDSVSKDMIARDFIYNLFDKLNVDEISEISILLIGENYKVLLGHELILGIFDGLMKNKFFDLLTTYKGLGFGK
jgi:hypothetical protein